MWSSCSSVFRRQASEVWIKVILIINIYYYYYYYYYYYSRDALDVFSHLSEEERSVLLEYPVHRLGQLLTGEGGKEIELQLQPEAPLEDDNEDNEGISTRGEGIREEEGDDELENEENECSAAKKRRIEEEPALPLALTPTGEDEVW